MASCVATVAKTRRASDGLVDFSVSVVDDLEVTIDPGLLDASLADPQPWMPPDPVAESLGAAHRDGIG